MLCTSQPSDWTQSVNNVLSTRSMSQHGFLGFWSEWYRTLSCSLKFPVTLVFTIIFSISLILKLNQFKKHNFSHALVHTVLQHLCRSLSEMLSFGSWLLKSAPRLYKRWMDTVTSHVCLSPILQKTGCYKEAWVWLGNCILLFFDWQVISPWASK